jgi:hypothetical protein
VNVAGVFKSQIGTPYGRILALSTDANGNAFSQGTINIFAEPRGTFRLPTINAFDLRVGKFLNYDRHRFEFIVDIFNLRNNNVVTDFNVNSGVVQDPLNVCPERGLLRRRGTSLSGLKTENFGLQLAQAQCGPLRSGSATRFRDDPQNRASPNNPSHAPAPGTPHPSSGS